MVDPELRAAGALDGHLGHAAVLAFERDDPAALADGSDPPTFHGASRTSARPAGSVSSSGVRSVSVLVLTQPARATNSAILMQFLIAFLSAAPYQGAAALSGRPNQLCDSSTIEMPRISVPAMAIAPNTTRIPPSTRNPA